MIGPALTSELLVGALNKHEHFNVVAGVATAQDVLKSAQSADFDVALIWATLADGLLSGIGTLRQLRECSPQVKAGILLEGRESNLVVGAFRAGARGAFNLSGSSFEELCKCVEQVYAGQTWANSHELAEVAEAFYQLAPMRVVNSDGIRLLTKREEDVVRLLAEGLQNRDIANELGLSEHTIKNYLFHIFDKLGVSSRVELVLYAVSSTNGMQTGGVRNSKKENRLAFDAESAVRLLAQADKVAVAKSYQSPKKGVRGQGLVKSDWPSNSLCG